MTWGDPASLLWKLTKLCIHFNAFFKHSDWIGFPRLNEALKAWDAVKTGRRLQNHTVKKYLPCLELFLLNNACRMEEKLAECVCTGISFYYDYIKLQYYIQPVFQMYFQ